MPFLQAPPAAGACGVLGDENGVVFHWGLLTVVGGIGGRQTLFDKISGVRQDGFQPLDLEIRGLPAAKPESAAKRRSAQRLE